ncbi:unnamed protein product [Auanema sp. JU1783]|nr:unnamed protein product [Auanema sp. JU1783]
MLKVIREPSIDTSHTKYTLPYYLIVFFPFIVVVIELYCIAFIHFFLSDEFNFQVDLAFANELYTDEEDAEESWDEISTDGSDVYNSDNGD